MKNKLLIIFLLILYSFSFLKVCASEAFNFDVTEIEISENGDKFIGKKRGKITSSDGIIINADQFEYYKKSNILYAKENIEIIDKLNKYLITSDNITYEKEKEIIFTNGNSQAQNLKMVL